MPENTLPTADEAGVNPPAPEAPKSTEPPTPPQARPVLVFPDPKLYEGSAYVDFTAPDHYVAPWGQTSLKALADDLVATVKTHKAAGISAIQVGVAVRVIVIVDSKDEPLVMVNPNWFFNANDEKFPVTEGCLSFPSIMEKVDRYTDVNATWVDLFGFKQEKVFSGIPAQAIQHEAEHLEGRLLIEHLPLHKRNSIRTKMKQYNRRVAGAQKAIRAMQSMKFRSQSEVLAFMKKSGLTTGR